MHITFLAHFLGSFAVASAFTVPQDWIVGLRQGHTLKEHLSLVGNNNDIKQYIPEINGYAIATSSDDAKVLSLIRQDPGVGFAVQKPQGFFSENAGNGLEGDDLDEYEVERFWSTLQDQDAQVAVTDDGATKIPLTWRIFFTDKAAKEEHIASVGRSFQINDVLLRSYWIVFDDQNHEEQYLSMIKDDPRVTAVYPERQRRGISYDEVEGEHPKSYTANDIVIHEEI